MLEDRLRSLPELQANSSQLAGLMVVHINWPGSASVVLDRPIGDPILKTIADRLRSLTAQDDYIAHLSGDDFAILSSGFNNSEEISQAALDLISKLQEPLQHEDEKLLLAPQMGVSIWPTDTQDAKSLLRNAYTAMFKSRIDETEHLNLYSSSIGQELKTRSELEQALISALENNEFQLYYQPQVNATDGRIIGFEALLRWHNEKLGWVGPDVFIPVAEHVGLITPIGEWVMETGFRQLQNWQEAGLGPLRLAINVSPLQFMLPEIDTCIQEKIEETGIEPGDIELEITEGSLMHDINTAVKVMKNIKQYGVELAIDDFGTGYSSLSSLRHFPLDRLKIDQSFTREIGVVNEATEITLTILAMAKQLNLSVIAEGVETQDQADFLRQNGCDEFQGYLYGRPASAAETTLLLHASKA
jgi:diguanylate cyclase (GGDEF)-like protein